MKQLVIIEIMNSEEKQRSKAMKIVVGIPGVESVALQGENKKQIAVIGYGVDSVNLMNLLRKKIRQVQLVSVTPVDENFLDDMFVNPPEAQHPTYYPRHSYQAVVPYHVQGYRSKYSDTPHYRSNYYDNYSYKSNDPDNCTIM